MIKTFERSGVKFHFPSNWTIDSDEAEGSGEWTVTIQSPETAFAIVSLRSDAQNLAQIADESLAALQLEYPDLEWENAIDSIAGQPAIGHNIDFLTLDTSTTCWSRCIETVNGPLLILCQVSDYDLSKNEPVLRAICASMQIADE